MASSDYKKANREVKGYVEVVYDVSNNSDIYTDLSISRNPNYTFNYSLTKAEYSQSLNDSYLTQRVANNYALLSNNLTRLDGSFLLFNKVSNSNGFYSSGVIDYYIEYIQSQGYSPRDFVLQIGKRNDLIINDVYGLSIYTINNNIIVSNHGNQIYGELYNEEGELIETTSDIKFYDSLHGGNQLLITFENSLNECYVMLKGFEFEYTDRPAIITHIDLGISHVYQNEGLIEFTVTEEVNKLVENTPANELSLTVGDYNMLYDPLNTKGITKYLTEDSIFVPYIGIMNESNYMEYTKMGEFYYNKIDYNDKQVTITAYNLINKLNRVMIKDTNKSLNSNLFIMPDHLQLRLETYLNTCYDYSYDISINNTEPMSLPHLKYDNLNLLLQKMAMIDGIYYVDRNNKIIVRNIDETIQEQLSKSELLEDIKYSNVNNTKGIKVLRKQTKSENKSTQITFEYKMTKEEEEICLVSDNMNMFGATATATNVDSISVISSDFFSIIFLKLVGTIGEVANITISSEREYTTNEIEYNFGEENPNIEIDNDLYYVRFVNDFDAFIEKIPTYEVSCDYNGNPTIHAGDYIEVESNYGMVPIFVQKHSLKFNGGLSGNIEGVE